MFFTIQNKHREATISKVSDPWLTHQKYIASGVKLIMKWFSVLALIFAITSLIERKLVCNGDTQIKSCLKSDEEALLDFRKGLNDPENRLSSWQGTNCCQWRGIHCDNNTGAVITVDLHNPYPLTFDSSTRYGNWNLSGEIRPSLLKLESLTKLDLSFNTFNSIPIPEFLGSLKNLRYLNLSKAGFTNKIPTNLGNLSSLQYLDLSSEIFGLTANTLQWVSGLRSLKHLEMTQVDLSMVNSDWLEVFNKLPILTELHLAGCSLSGSVSSINYMNFSSLAYMNLGLNNLNSKFPDWVVNVSGLVHIDMSSNNFYGRIPLGLGELPSLKHLDLAMNKNLTASCSKLLRKKWEKIEVLRLSSNKIHGKLPASVGNITTLTEFDLFSNNVEGGIQSTIGKLCRLRYFDLSGNNLTGSLPDFIEGSRSCFSKSTLPSLRYLELSNNHLVGKLPEWLGELTNLVELSLSYNSLHGPIPASIGKLSNLTEIGLAGNNLNGSLPESLGQISQLTSLDVSSNKLTGIISEAHFLKLSKLKLLLLSSNSLILSVSSNWVPPFQVRNLDLGSCQLGPLFPAWVEYQKEIMFLDFSNASIGGSIPSWFWDNISSNLSLLNVSFNQLHGQLPNPLNIAPYADVDFSSNNFEGPIPLPEVEIELLDLSNNQFSGSLPRNIAETLPNLIFLSLSNNHLTGEMPDSLGNMVLLGVIDLSMNNFTGKIPSSLGSCSFLKVLDLGNNNLSGLIPGSLGQLSLLQSLHLNGNKLSGSVPSPFLNLSSLETLDMGNNNLRGEIPPWIGTGFPNLRIISLRANAFSGKIPSELSNLSSLQVIDFAENDLDGSIPGSFGKLKALAQSQIKNHYLFYGMYRGIYYEENLIVNINRAPQKYAKTLSLMTSIDLSENNLEGEFPQELTKLSGLVVLNLSRNQLHGRIPDSISGLNDLSSLDLSNNLFTGSIPPTVSSLTFLSHLNLSNNNLSGQIPSRTQMMTFGESSFAGNLGLCGGQLKDCRSEDTGGQPAEENGGDNGYIDKWFYSSVGLGFAAGILIPFLILAITRSWSDAYFSFVDKIVERLLLMTNRRRRRRRDNHRRRR